MSHNIKPDSSTPSPFILRYKALENLNNQILISPYPDIINVYLEEININLVKGKFPVVEIMIQELILYLDIESRDNSNQIYLRNYFGIMLIIANKLIPALMDGN